MQSVGPIKTLREIDTDTREGRLLMAAIGKIKQEQRRKGVPMSETEIICYLNKLEKNIFENDNPGRDKNPAGPGAELETPIR